MSGAARATTGAIQWRPPPTRVAYSQYVHDTANCPRTHDRLSLCGSLTKLANVTAQPSRALIFLLFHISNKFIRYEVNTVKDFTPGFGAFLVLAIPFF